jgi:hypothetical protein
MTMPETPPRHRLSAIIETTRATSVAHGRQLYRASCICGWRATGRHQTAEAAFTDARRRHGLIPTDAEQGSPI